MKQQSSDIDSNISPNKSMKKSHKSSKKGKSPKDLKEGDFDQYIQSAKDYINKDNDCEQIKEHSNEDTQEQDGSLMDFDPA